MYQRSAGRVLGKLAIPVSSREICVLSGLACATQIGCMVIKLAGKKASVNGPRGAEYASTRVNYVID